MESYRFSSSTVVEPLVQRWPAWSHTLHPVAACFHLANYQIPTLESFVAAPEVHVAACQDPELLGGPFVDIPAGRAAEAERLLAEMRTAQAARLELARSVAAFGETLIEQARGQNLREFYARMPAVLRGRTEIGYDYYDRPLMRLLDGPMLRSEIYAAGLQSLRIFRLQRDDDRGFIMSTPRLPCPGDVDVAVPFDDERARLVLGLDVRPRPAGEIFEALGVGRSADSLLRLLEPGPAKFSPRWNGPSVRCRYFGHACVLVEGPSGTSVLVDPFIAPRPAGGGLERFSYDDLPERIDFVVVTHDHHDHFSVETLLRLRERVGCLVVPRSLGVLHGDISLGALARRLGFRNVIELGEWDRVPTGEGEITALPFLGEHADLFQGNKLTYVARFGREQVMFAADADCVDVEMYAEARRVLGSVDTVFIGTESVGAPLSWTSGPLFPRKPPKRYDQTRRYHGCDSAAALRLIEAVGAKRVFVYAIGLEPWMKHLLGLNLTPDSPQFRDSEEVLSRARSRGLEVVERLFGRADILLEPRLRSARVAWESHRRGAPAGRLSGVLGARAGGASVNWREIEPDVSAAVSALAAREGCTPEIVIGAAGAAVLGARLGDDMLLAVAGVANRGELSMRLDLSGSPSLQQILRRFQAAIARAAEAEAGGASPASGAQGEGLGVAGLELSAAQSVAPPPTWALWMGIRGGAPAVAVQYAASLTDDARLKDLEALWANALREGVIEPHTPLDAALSLSVEQEEQDFAF